MSFTYAVVGIKLRNYAIILRLTSYPYILINLVIGTDERADKQETGETNMIFIVDIKGHKNLEAVEIPSAVGMRGLYIHELAGEYDYPTYEFEARLGNGVFRTASRTKR